MKHPHDLLAYDAAIFSTAFTFLKTRMHLFDGTDMHFLDSQTQELLNKEVSSKSSPNIFFVLERKNLGVRKI